jgi:hypothetical protein
LLLFALLISGAASPAPDRQAKLPNTGLLFAALLIFALLISGEAGPRLAA